MAAAPAAPSASYASIPAQAAPGTLHCEVVLATEADQRQLLSKLKAALALAQQQGIRCAARSCAALDAPLCACCAS